MKSSLTRLIAVFILPASLAQASPISFKLEQVVNSNQRAPSGNLYRGSYGFDEPGVSSNGLVAFRSEDSNRAQFIEAGTPGSLFTIAASGDRMPTLPPLPAGATYSSFDDNVQVEGNTVLFKATPNAGNDGRDTRQQVLIQDVSGVKTVILQEGASASPATGLPISSIDSSEGYGLGIGRSVVEISERNAAGDKSILLFQGGSLSVVQTQADTPPVGKAYEYLADAYADRNGPGIIFDADMDSAAISALVLTEDSGATLSVVAQTGDSVTGSDGALEYAYEGMIDYGNIAAMALFDNGNRGVVFKPAGGPLQAIAEVGATNTPGDGVLTEIYDVALSGETVFFEGEVRGADVLLAWNNGVLTEILRAGDVLDGITVEEIHFNRGGAAGGFFGFSINGKIGDDPASAVYRGAFTVIPEPTTLALLGLGGLVVLTRRRRSAREPY